MSEFVTIGEIALIQGPQGPAGPNTVPTNEVIAAALAPYAKTSDVLVALGPYAKTTEVAAATSDSVRAARAQPFTVERVGFGGDSNTAYNGLDNWTAMLVNLGRGRAARVGVWATGGMKIGGWRDTHLPTVLATTGRDRPDAMVMMLGTNDVLAAIPDTISSYRNEVLQPLINAGMRPLICSIPPRTDSANAKTWTEQFNLALARLADSMRVPFLDVYAQLVEPANGNFKAGFSAQGIDGSVAGDGIHFFKQEAQAAVAKGIRGAFLAALSGSGARFLRSNTDTTNNAANGLMLIGGGKFLVGSPTNANYPAQWETNTGQTVNSGGPSLVQDAYGSWAQVAVDSTGFFINRYLGVPITAGKRYEVLIKVRPVGFGSDAAAFSARASWLTSSTGSTISSVPGAPIGAQKNIRPNLIDLTADPSDFLVARLEGVAPANATVVRLEVTSASEGASLAGKTLGWGAVSVTEVA